MALAIRIVIIVVVIALIILVLRSKLKDGLRMLLIVLFIVVGGIGKFVSHRKMVYSCIYTGRSLCPDSFVRGNHGCHPWEEFLYDLLLHRRE